jgi:outer membrane protein assembly factor BamB
VRDAATASNSSESNATDSNSTDGSLETNGPVEDATIDEEDSSSVDVNVADNDDQSVGVDNDSETSEPRVIAPEVVAPRDDQVALGDSGAAAAARESHADPLDWPYLRGPHYNGVSYETGLVDDFDPAGGDGSNIAWKREDLGTRSTPIVMNGKLYTLDRSFEGTAREGERVVCIDAATGENIWEHAFNVWHSDVPDTRVAWSSVVGDPETGNVYAQGVCGLFLCLDGETGKVIWSRASHEEDGFLSTYGGRTNFPVVFEDLVITSSVYIGWGDNAKPNHRFMAFDKHTGEVVYFNSTTPLPDDTTYSAPALGVINGQQSLVVACGDGKVWSFQPRTGKSIWNFQLSRRGVNTPPLIVGDRVFCSHSEEVPELDSNRMGGVVALKADGSGVLAGDSLLWRHDERMCGKSAPVLVDGLIYVFEDGGTLRIFNADNGDEVELQVDKKVERQIKFRNMRSNPLVADGKIYAFSEAGQWWIAKPNKEKGLEIVSFSGRDKQVGECNASPIVSHGRIYVTSSDAIYCLEDKAKEHGVAKAPTAPRETPTSEDPKPALVQVIPAESLIRPGEKLEFKVRLFNARGQFLKEEPAPEWSVVGAGEVESDGSFTAAADAQHDAAFITAKVGDLQGTASVRVVPDLPWKFDFENVELVAAGEGKPKVGQPPVTWTGMRYRHVVREVDGNKVMVKITTIPKGTRSQGFLGRSDLHDYTMQADILGVLTEGQLPEVGLNVQGYTFAMQGNNQILQMRTWVTQERLALHPANRNEDGSLKCKFPYKWEGNKWYTMKLKVSNAGDVAKLQGKVWPRDEQEPVEWTMECEDPAPQRTGAPGFYADSSFAELFIDNITVTPNEAAAE